MDQKENKNTIYLEKLLLGGIKNLNLAKFNEKLKNEIKKRSNY